MTDSVKGRFGVPMSTLLLLAALLLPQAEAAAPKDVGVATLEGVVEVPLYPSESAEDPTWFVEATVGETTLWLRVATARDGVALTSAAAKKIGKKPAGEDKAFTFDLSLGAAAFARVKATAADDIKGADGEIGLGAFPSLAWAVLPSKGVLRVARASEAAALRAGELAAAGLAEAAAAPADASTAAAAVGGTVAVVAEAVVAVVVGGGGGGVLCV
jgi:hypothetical protein